MAAFVGVTARFCADPDKAKGGSALLELELAEVDPETPPDADPDDDDEFDAAADAEAPAKLLLELPKPLELIPSGRPLGPELPPPSDFGE